jgi:hypothetical protein
VSSICTVYVKHHSIGKASIFKPWLSLSDLSALAFRPSSLHFFAFRNSNFFTQQGPQRCVQLPNLEDQISVPMSPSDRVSQLWSQDSQDYGGGILTHHHTGSIIAHKEYMGKYVTGARGSVVSWDTMLQAWRSLVWFPMRSLDFFNWPNTSSRTMTMGSTRPLTEMRTRILLRGKGRPERKAWPRGLTALLASTVCYRGSFTFLVADMFVFLF